MARKIGQVTVRDGGVVVNSTPTSEYPQALPQFKGNLSGWSENLGKWYQNLVLVLLRNYGKDGLSVQVYEDESEPSSARSGDVWKRLSGDTVIDVSVKGSDGVWTSLIGPRGLTGLTGLTGEAGRSVQIFEQAEEPEEAEAGDFWITP